MSYPYPSALEDVRAAAREVRKSRPPSAWHERVPLADAQGRIAAVDILSPESTPAADTSAMDGYAVLSTATISATLQSPVLFRVCGTIAAGDDPNTFAACFHSSGSGNGNGTESGGGGIDSSGCSEPDERDACLPPPCVEIMTGARFPTISDARPGATSFLPDACIRVEDVIVVSGRTHTLPGDGDPPRCIAVTAPVRAGANRRVAGEDIRRGQVVLCAGQVLRSPHIILLASVGITDVVVVTRPAVGIFSTGKELVRRGPATLPDANGPFLVAACGEAGAKSVFLGSLDDDAQAMARALRDQTDEVAADVIISSGGVSVGKFDFVRQAVDLIGGRVVFHGLSIRPGHPVLFALIPSSGGTLTPFFGLPGNPGATAVCCRFLVVPYLRALMGQNIEKPVPAVLKNSETGDDGATQLQNYESFRPGFLQATAEGTNVVMDVGKNKGPSKLSPFISANCWIHHGRGRTGNIVDCYALSPRADPDL